MLYIFFGISLLLFSSCNTVKYVADNEHLLTKNTITVNDKKNVDDDINNYIIQRPNRLTLGIPVALNFYNWGDKDLETKYLKGIDTFSKKRDRPKEYKKFKYKFNHWKFKNGEAPVILDSSKTKLTANKLQDHFFNQGYFRAKVDYKETRKNNKLATVGYTVKTGKVFLLDSISKNIKSPVLDSIFELHKNETLIKTKEEYNDLNFANEADRITKLYRNSGIYHFTRGAIGYKADSAKNSYKVDVKLHIGDRIIERNDSIFTTQYTIQKISKVDVYTDYSFNKKEDPYTKTDSYNGINFHAHDELKYNSKLLSNSIFIEPNNIYRDEDKNLTRKHLRGLQNFKIANVKYEEIDSANLAAKIYLTPYKKYSFSANTELTHSNIKQLGVSGKISTLNRNTFKGAEILRFSVQGSFFNTSRDAGDNTGGFFNAFEFGGDVSLEIPRILFPAKTENLILKKMSPKTKISIGTSFQKNIGLDKQKFTGIIDYNWQASKKKKHRLELINAQFIRNLNTSSYFNIYQSEYNSLTSISDIISQTTTIPSNNFDSNGNIIPSTFIDYVTDATNGFQTTNLIEFNNVQNIEKRRNIITQDALVPVISYEYTYNNSKNYKDANFSFFRARIASSGVLSSALSTKTNANGQKEILGIPVAQYIKTDFEYKKFWGNSSDNVLAFRGLLGIAIPYGNSDEIPFSRSYFIGGANDLRAWKIYDIGPGSIQNGLEYNVGSLKILSSLEYRFKIINSVKGALFVDAGNIWDITKTDLIADEGKFNGIKSLNQIAVGTGFGIRYDFNFLVIRLDLGFKTYEPYQPDNLKWLSNYNFGNAVYNIGINYPF
ncbi:MAG: hypothetical protein COA67_09850 [Lutibacter sp.]|nr:MAG: hypothetical protein COA67_09850 [Lutibacter sp.]